MSFERRWNSEWGRLRYESEEVIDLGDRLVLIGRFEATGPSSGAGFDNQQFAEIFTISAGRVIREQAFFDHADALEAAGLRG